MSLAGISAFGKAARLSILFGCLIAAPVLLSACSKSDSKAESFAFPPASVKVGKAEAGTIRDSSLYTATVVSRQSVNLMPQVDGHITKIFFNAGAELKHGQSIIQISPEHQQASVRSYAAAQDSATDELENAKHTLKSLEASRLAKQSALNLAQINRERYAKLRSSGAVSQEELDSRLNALEAARADLMTADAQIRAQESQVRHMEKMLQSSRANLDQQQAQLQYYTIRAPFDGLLGDVPVKIGDYVNQQTKLATLTQNHPVEIYINVPVERSKQVRPNMPVELIDSNDKTIGTSNIFFISPNITADSQTILLKASFANKDDQLRADQQIKARVVWSKRPGVLVPTEAVGHQNGQDFVFLAGTSGGKPVAKQVPIKLGAIEGNKYQVLEGLKAGESLIFSGIQNLADGSPINPTI